MDQIVAPPSRRERKKLETAARLKAAAFEIFAREGFDNAKIKDVAERADVAERTLFNYVADKRDLLAFIFAEDYLAIAGEAFLPERADMPLADQLEREFGRSVEYFRRFSPVSLVLFREGIWYDTSPHLLHLRQGRAVLGANLLAMVRRKQAAGEINDAVKPEDLTWVLIAIFISNLRELLDLDDERASAAVAAAGRQFRLVLGGLAAPRG